MEIILRNPKSKYSEIVSLKELNNVNRNLKKISSPKGVLEAKIFAINESISCDQLSEIKNNINKINTCSLCIYSNNRNTILSGKFLKINSTFLKEKEVKKKLLLLKSTKKDDTLYEGTVRSGDRITSNGNLCIIGDVNPGAIVSA